MIRNSEGVVAQQHFFDEEASQGISVGHRDFFWTGTWKWFRILAMVQLPFEMVIVFLAGATTQELFYIFGGTPILCIIAACLVTCPCRNCCNQSDGQCTAIAHIVLTAIPIPGSVGYFFYLASDYGSYDNEYEGLGYAFGVICLGFRIARIVLASVVSFQTVSCCGQQRNVQVIEMVNIPTAQNIVPPVVHPVEIKHLYYQER